MKQKQFYAILFLFIIALSVKCMPQEPPCNYLGASVGFGFAGLKDLHAAQLVYSGSFGFTPSVSYLRIGKSTRQFIDAVYYYNLLDASAPNFHAFNWRGRFSYNLLFNIGELKLLNNKVMLFAGGGVSSIFSKARYYNEPNQVLNFLYESWYWQHSLDAALLAEYKPSENQFLNLRLNIPVISNVSRPDYSFMAEYLYPSDYYKIKTFGKTEFLTDNFYLCANVSYTASIAPKLYFTFNYEFLFASYNKPAEIKMVFNSIRAGILCGF